MGKVGYWNPTWSWKGIVLFILFDNCLTISNTWLYWGMESEINVANSHKVEQPFRNYCHFLFELCCRVRRLSSETEDWLWNRKLQLRNVHFNKMQKQTSMGHLLWTKGLGAGGYFTEETVVYKAYRKRLERESAWMLKPLFNPLLPRSQY